MLSALVLAVAGVGAVGLVTLGTGADLLAAAGGRRAPAPPPAEGAGPGWAEALAPEAVRFQPNQGRHPEWVRFSTVASGREVLLSAEGLAVRGGTGGPLGLRFAGADPGAAVVGVDPLASVSTVARGRAGATSAPDYGAVRYRQLYPGVDAVVRSRGAALEYDLEVAPGIDPGVVAVAGWAGGPGPVVTPAGDLVVGEGAGALRFGPPELYQVLDGHRVAVEGGYLARPDGTVGFRVGPYDPGRTLIIDPVLVGSTYLGGSSADTGYDVAVDPQGDLVVAGFTESSDFPVASAQQAELARTEEVRKDAFVAKLAADGSGLVWSTYLGGLGKEEAYAVAVAGDGSVFVTGYTDSTDFPVVGGVQTTYGGGAADAFVTKLDPGGRIVYSTFLGGSGNDAASGIAVGADGSVVITGATGSLDLPVASAFADRPAGSDDLDAFVAKLAPDGASLVYSTYLGGSDDEHALDVAVDGAGNAYVVGDTRSTNFPTANPLQATSGGSGTGLGTAFADGFVTKLSADGTALVYSTYLGGSDSEQVLAVAVDDAGSAYVTGNTGSATFPVVNALSDRKDGDFDAFVAKLAPGGQSLEFSTFLGGSGADNGDGLALGPSTVVVVGSTASDDFPTRDAFQGSKGGGGLDGFVAELELSGQGVVASSYLGGVGDDQVASVSVRPDGDVAVIGYTTSDDFPTAQPLQARTGGGVGDVFVSRVRSEGGVAGPLTRSTDGGHQARVRLLTVLAGLLLLAAVAQTLWLRSRRGPAVPEPVRVDEPAAGLGYVPRRGRLEARTVDGRAFGEPRSVVVDDRRRGDDEEAVPVGGEVLPAANGAGLPLGRRGEGDLDPLDWEDPVLDEAFARFWGGDPAGEPARRGDESSLDAFDLLGAPESAAPVGDRARTLLPGLEDEIGDDLWLPRPGASDEPHRASRPGSGAVPVPDLFETLPAADWQGPDDGGGGPGDRWVWDKLSPAEAPPELEPEDRWAPPEGATPAPGGVGPDPAAVGHGASGADLGPFPESGLASDGAQAASDAPPRPAPVPGLPGDAPGPHEGQEAGAAAGHDGSATRDPGPGPAPGPGQAHAAPEPPGGQGPGAVAPGGDRSGSDPAPGLDPGPDRTDAAPEPHARLADAGRPDAAPEPHERLADAGRPDAAPEPHERLAEAGRPDDGPLTAPGAAPAPSGPPAGAPGPQGAAGGGRGSSEAGADHGLADPAAPGARVAEDVAAESRRRAEALAEGTAAAFGARGRGAGAGGGGGPEGTEGLRSEVPPPTPWAATALPPIGSSPEGPGDGAAATSGAEAASEAASDRPGPGAEPRGDLSVTELLDEDLPIPGGHEPASGMSMRALFDEELAPEAQPEARLPLAPVPEGLFDPDPDDPLVQATLEEETGPERDAGGGRGRWRRRRGGAS